MKVQISRLSPHQNGKVFAVLMGQPIIPPNLREKPHRPVNSSVITP